MSNVWEKSRTKVFAELGFPLPLGYAYDWDAVRPSDGALLLQVSTEEMSSGWNAGAIPILDNDSDAKNRYPKLSLHRHYKRKANVTRAIDNKSIAYVIAAKMNPRGSGSARTQAICKHQTYRVLEFFTAEYNGHPDAVFARINKVPAYNGWELT